MSKLKENDTKLKSLDKNIKKLSIQPTSKKQTLPKMRLSLPQITPTSDRLKSKISQFKSHHAELTKNLEDAILNNNLYRSVSASEFKSLVHVQFLDKRHAKKQKSLTNLQKKMQKRISLNQEAQTQLEKIEQEIFQKKSTVAKRLSEIQARNLQKIKQIEDFQKEFLQKVKLELNRNMQKEKKLKRQFERIKQQNTKLAKAKEFENKLDNEGWKSIMQEKINLESLMQNQKEKQLKLIKQKNIETTKKSQKTAAKDDEKKPFKERVKLDMKEAGRQYLDFAKKKGSNGPRETKQIRKNYMNINLKVINYENDILERIGNNDGLLSQVQHHSEARIPDSKNPLTQTSVKPPMQSLHQIDMVPILQQQQQDSEGSQFSDMEKTANLVQKIKHDIELIEERYQKNGKSNYQ